MSVEILEEIYRTQFKIEPILKVKNDPIKKGASGRTITRLKAENAPACIGIHYTDARSDNAFHKPISDFLEDTGVRVPRILFADLEAGILLVEDVGHRDLLSLKGLSWEERESYYRSTFRELSKISRATPPEGLEMMEPFTEETYLWEQGYFAEHFVGTHLGKDAEGFLANPLIRALATELGAQQPDLVHRDFQSQNLMLNAEEVVVIDFQGARKGYVEYDLASFIYDPYMRHPREERDKLRVLWSEESGRALDSQLIRRCALQRLMQALGAYGNIVYNQKNDWYAQHMEPAVEMLLSLSEDNEYQDVFHPLLKG